MSPNLKSKIQSPKSPTRWQNLFLAAVVAGGAIVLGYLVIVNSGEWTDHAEAGTSKLRLEDIPFNGRRAYDYLNRLCDIGVRQSGSPGMAEQRKLLVEHFEKLGAKVTLQEFPVRSPLDGSSVTLANVIVEWHPEKRERVLLAAHYDTRPYPDRDPERPRGTFVGANDGGSGVAVLMELAHAMPTLDGRYGVDFVLFDGEELVYREATTFRAGDPYFLGSEYFARRYAAEPPKHRYRWGVLLDMVGDADLQIPYEKNSLAWRDTRPLVQEIWKTARRLGVNEFIPRRGDEIRDDHLQLHDIAKIPTCDVIDFKYPHWHTEGDTADKCSALSLAKVGWVLEEWLKGL